MHSHTTRIQHTLYGTHCTYLCVCMDICYLTYHFFNDLLERLLSLLHVLAPLSDIAARCQVAHA